MSLQAIDEIEDRLEDLTAALREAGAENLALNLERHANDFTQPTRVRRSVNALREQVEQFRQGAVEVPDSPKVMLAANRLEDVCRDALKAGVIAAAPLTLAAQSRRKAAIVLGTLLLGGVSLLIPIVLVRAGVDFNDLVRTRRIGPFSLPRGEESKVPIAVLREALVPKAVRGVEFEPEGGCREALSDDATCSEAPPRLWAEGRLPTYEQKLRNQAYGLVFSIAAPHVASGRFGEAELLLAATDDTPEGRYTISLRGAYLGYTPQSCELYQRVLGDCPPPREGERERHADLPVATVIVDVTPGDPARRLGEKRLKLAEAEEARKAAEQRAKQINAAVSTIDTVLRETEKLMARARYEEVRVRVRKLATLFAPLEANTSLSVAEGESPAVSEVRTRFEALRDKLQKFEDKLFEQTFVAETAESNRRVPEDSLLARIAQRAGVSIDYVRDIYTSRADEIQHRLEAKNQAHVDKLKAEEQAREQRCGTLPLDAWHSVERYVREAFSEPHVEIVLGECLTPRLTERECWEMRCDYQRVIEVAVERPKLVEKHAATFYLARGKVVRHR